jgi:ABC-2 type transport system ATP-binding protein
VGAALSISGLTKTYKGGKEALRGVDLEVGEGCLIGLLGPNGAGKSTLTKIACGLVRPSSGEVKVAGAAAGSVAARRATGYLAELFRFPGWLSALELLELHQRLAGSTGGAAERDELLEMVGLEQAREVRVEAMSKGMQQRLGIAQAMIGSPGLLLLDEPTSALDPAGRRVVRELLLEARSRGIGVLLNSHLLGEVERVCDAVTIIDDGRVVAAGPPADLAGARAVEIETDAGLVRRQGVDREQIPALVRELVAAGRDVFAVRESGSSLEDAYLQVVKGGDRRPDKEEEDGVEQEEEGR